MALTLGCRASSRPRDVTRVYRELSVRVPAQPEADRWFATIYTLQRLFVEDGRLRAEFVERLGRLLALSPDADLTTIAHALQTRAAAGHWTLQVAETDAPEELDANVARWAQALRTRDPDPEESRSLLALEVHEDARVRCAPPDAACELVARALEAELWQSIVRGSVFDALASSESLREAVRARGRLLKTRASPALAAEFDAALEFLTGLETRAAAMVVARTQRARWIRSMTTNPPAVDEDEAAP